MTQTILITGTSSGLGLAFLKHFRSVPSAPTIIGLDSRPLPQTGYDRSTSSTITTHVVDITSPEDVTSLLTKYYKSTPIDLIIHSAGVRGLVPHIVEQQPGDVSAAETLDIIDQTTMLKTFDINTWGTFNLIRTFLPNLLLQRETPDTSTTTLPKVVIMSSRMGSIAANVAGGSYAYRASKAALNAVVKSFSVDVPGVVFLLLHPGRVETGLVACKEEGAMTVEESLEGCLKIIEGLGKEDSGKFVDRFGMTIPW
ncbi:NAD(P)-binding protein [Pyrenochaeta sp. DS3sAY3a]|nr:NAD(P)-binding protein [Pyrenochaeta sp. DS3sAY3a]